jgi:uncharacterized phage protein gp47/JayE
VTTYPLATLACTVTSAGITAPDYASILLSLQASYQAIYGADVDLDPDTQDGQWLAIMALAINDCNQACIAVYNQFSPATAVGNGLSSVVKINGLQREVSSESTCDITLVGQAGTPLINCLVGDDQNLGTQWALPASVTIPSGGSITVTAACTTQGATTAAPNTLTVLLTPTSGWQSASNAGSAAPGNPVESDATLRQRQTVSTALPAQTVLDGIIGDLLNLPGVTAVAADNNTSGTTDGNGVPGHTLCMIVQGGNIQDIVNVIGLKKTIGCGTYGNTSGTYVDAYGRPETIYFEVPTQITIKGAVVISPLSGYSSAVGTEIIAACVAAVNASTIGQNVLYTRLYAPALLVGPYAAPASPTDPSTYELTSVEIAASPSSPVAADVSIAFNQIAVTAVSSWTLTT